MALPFDFAFPYASRRMPVLARNVVATSQPLAVQAGMAMLHAGGNAVDAALAAAIALTVVEPTSNGIGSDAYCILWDGQELTGLNASGRAPAGWTAEYFARKYPGRTTPPERGIDSVTIPGCVSAWVALSERYGKLPFRQLFEPAIRYARAGHHVSPITAESWSRQAAVISEADFSRDFTLGGAPPKPGALWRFPAQGDTLQAIAESRGQAFYGGGLAERMAEHAKALGGCHTVEDFARHTADWVNPIGLDYRGYRLHQIPPNGQGIAALIALGILREFDLGSLAVDGADSVHLQLEAMKLAFADVYAEVADRPAMRVSTEQMLDRDYLRQRAACIDRKRASPGPAPGLPTQRGTVYLTTADASGMMVSYIQSNYMGFGSGVIPPGTGISLQNRGHGFTLRADHPNRVAPGKRPFQTIIPGFVTRDGAPVMAFGVMGGNMQPQGHVQMLTRIVDYGQNPQAAADAPRWVVNPDFSVGLEPGFSASVAEELLRRGHRLADADAINFAFGGAQLAWRAGDHYVAASDPRKDGGAAGF
jgi:gamma-glutamyltranspeptidase/glutathione hydrolase